MQFQNKSFIEPSEWIWHVEDIENDKGVYVDLKLNPEAYTGYQGQHIWDVIYRENCYQGILLQLNLNNRFFGLNVQREKSIKQVSFQVYMHQLSTQLSEFYVDLKTNRTYPNYSSKNQKSFLFIFCICFVAIILATPGIQQYDINSLSFEDDLRSKQLLNQILSLSNSQCSRPFDEQQFFKQITFEQKKDYQRYIHNISRIMDCVECQKCKVFGKMQTYGLGTALKILFSESPSEFSGRLKRNELVALINTFWKGIKFCEFY
ncbi:unnamed protein product (macronuclear) [Paramecium tetraurelia]|uniref:Uncharacterized protein n=1 Tax=Paramecium tetraurelia TaxID=5888 RepID=A0C4N7_PARTE|nr:uncharacterized protein GSPATT00006253001 [Paramecium tetraurelia]CAK65754.1 unnamed protein product [Paramecium tetraurelia]|eukprot:XP_001433151.1 hypothetical protein (macronuclear) [Paramecium tetraurelia strain d4-2]